MWRILTTTASRSSPYIGTLLPSGEAEVVLMENFSFRVTIFQRPGPEYVGGIAINTSGIIYVVGSDNHQILATIF